MRGTSEDPITLIELMGKAVDYVRSSAGRCWFRADTYRLMAHSKSDDDRDKAEIEAYWQRDLLHCARLNVRTSWTPSKQN